MITEKMDFDKRLLEISLTSMQIPVRTTHTEDGKRRTCSRT